jgi:oligopeptide transport system substrate-binding protein
MWLTYSKFKFKMPVATRSRMRIRLSAWFKGVRTLGAILFVSAMCFVAACQRNASQPTDNVGAGVAERILRRGIGPEPDSLDPQKTRADEGQSILRDLFECLTSLDHEGRPAAGTAVAWSISPDGRTYTFTLRPNARWSNGDPVTGADFVAGLKRLVDPATASGNAALVDVIHNAREITKGSMSPDELGVFAPNSSTVVIVLEHPAPYLPSLLSHPSTCPLHQTTPKDAGKDMSRSVGLVSNGAFVLTAWVPGDRIVARRNRFYWNDKQTYWDQVIYLQIEDAAAEFLRYRAGQIDITVTIPRAQLSFIQETLAAELHVTPALGINYYGFNLNRAPFRDNLKVRQALDLALDRTRIVQSVVRTGEIPAYTWVPPGVNGYQPAPPGDSSLTQEQRVGLARQLLKEAGYSKERPLRFELRYNTGEILAKVALATAAMWKETLGVEVRTTSEEFRTLLADMDTGDVQMFRSIWMADYNDPLAFLQLLQSGSGLSSMHYHSAKFDELLAAAESQIDPDKRVSVLRNAERTALADAPVVPIYFSATKHLVKPSIRGWYDNVMNVTYSKDLSRGSR